MRKFIVFSCFLFVFGVTIGDRALLGGTETIETQSAVPRYTLNDAILAALQRNPDIQRARQEIERTKGLYLQMRADALPRIDATGSWTDTDPHLTHFTGDGGTGAGIGSNGFTNVKGYSKLTLRATKIIFAGGGLSRKSVPRI